jgi:hypothetical protein
MCSSHRQYNLEWKHLLTRVRRALIHEESSMVFVSMRDRFYSRMQQQTLQRVDDIISAV